MPTSTSDHKKKEVENILNFLTQLRIFQHLDSAAIQAVVADLGMVQKPRKLD